MNSPTSSLGPRGRGPAGGGWPEEAKRWPAHNFRVRGSSCVHGEWRHCATSGRGAPGMGGERYAAATLWGPHRGTRPFSPARAAPDHIPCASRTSWVPCSTRPGGAARVRVREMALWEDRSAPHSSAVSWEPRNHAETAGCAWCVGPNDPPAAPEPEFDGVEERPRARRRGPTRRSARDRGPAAQGRPGRSRKTRREPIRPSMRTRTPPRPRPIPRRGARGACRGGAGEVI